jgi:hypothetical protein
MGKQIADIFGLVVIAGIIGVLAKKPQVVGTFFNGSSKLLGTALG